MPPVNIITTYFSILLLLLQLLRINCTSPSANQPSTSTSSTTDATPCHGMKKTPAPITLINERLPAFYMPEICKLSMQLNMVYVKSIYNNYLCMQCQLFRHKLLSSPVTNRLAITLQTELTKLRRHYNRKDIKKTIVTSRVPEVQIPWHGHSAKDAATFWGLNLNLCTVLLPIVVLNETSHAPVVRIYNAVKMHMFALIHIKTELDHCLALAQSLQSDERRFYNNNDAPAPPQTYVDFYLAIKDTIKKIDARTCKVHLYKHNDRNNARVFYLHLDSVVKKIKSILTTVKHKFARAYKLNDRAVFEKMAKLYPLLFVPLDCVEHVGGVDALAEMRGVGVYLILVHDGAVSGGCISYRYRHVYVHFLANYFMQAVRYASGKGRGGAFIVGKECANEGKVRALMYAALKYFLFSSTPALIHLPAYREVCAFFGATTAVPDAHCITNSVSDFIANPLYVDEFRKIVDAYNDRILLGIDSVVLNADNPFINFTPIFSFLEPSTTEVALYYAVPRGVPYCDYVNPYKMNALQVLVRIILADGDFFHAWQAEVGARMVSGDVDAVGNFIEAVVTGNLVLLDVLGGVG